MQGGLSRREALRVTLGGLGLLASGGNLVACGGGLTTSRSPREREAPRVSNIANLAPLEPPDVNGLRLPPGFTSRVVATTGLIPCPGASYPWHAAPDGGATFATADGGWIYVSNSELDTGGGAGALRFAPSGAVIDAYPILSGTSRNCAGGPTPWGTWLSCEEAGGGRVWECQPAGGAAVVHDALGVFVHEAVCIDPVRGQLYLTEDDPEGRLYRFTPTHALPDLSTGTLEVLRMEAGQEGPVRWDAIADPTGASGDPRYQAPNSTPFNGGEGAWYQDGVVYFATKGDNRVWALDVATQELWILYDDTFYSPSSITGVDNVTTSEGGDVLVAEDGGEMRIVAITKQNTLVPLVQVVGHDGSEITGPALDPSGTRLYLSSQRGADGVTGVTYEVSGPFVVPSLA